MKIIKTAIDKKVSMGMETDKDLPNASNDLPSVNPLKDWIGSTLNDEILLKI